MTTTNLSAFEQRVLIYIVLHPGVTGAVVAEALGVPNAVYGKQRSTSGAIARLRALRLLEDCPRCRFCRRALSRGSRNVRLWPTLLAEAVATAPALT